MNIPAEYIKKIIHVDMDAFYASVEQLDKPELRGKPLVVGGSSRRGVIAAASYEARRYGVKSAMPGFIAKEKCPHLIFVKPNFQRYKEISYQIREIFYEYTDLVEPLSLDEAFLDVTENKMNNPSATLIAQEIRNKIKLKTGLNASAGISINKFIAKVASDINKPNGQKTIMPDEVETFLEELTIEKFFGIGKVTAEKMHRLNIFKGADLKNKSIEYLTNQFGKSGKHYYDIVRGIHRGQVRPDRIRKSLGAERTFMEDLYEDDYLIEKLEQISDEIEIKSKKADVKGKTVTLKIKYSDFIQQTRSKTLPYFVSTKNEIMPMVLDLFGQDELKKSVRLLGITLSNLDVNDNKDIGLQLQIKFPNNPYQMDK